MANDVAISAGLQVDGEKEFKDAVNKINKDITVLTSEMKKVTAQFADNADAQKAASAQAEVYERQIAKQKEQINKTREALANAKKEYGDNSTQVKDWQIKLNKAEEQLAKSETALRKLHSELDNSESAFTAAGEFAEKYGGILAGVGAALGGVAAAAGAAAVKLGQEVVEQFGALEQNLGGSVAVFGQYAQEIQKTGEEAYRKLGVSQSEYLAQANKMGALLQGAGLAQKESLDLTAQAMQRAADMASVMGIETSAALEAVTAAAKGNFTMMDNLGVAMNATTLEAYALSKGLDFTWASASNAEKAQLAMQMFFEKTQQYAGNFEREATETITGSLGLLQAALTSFTAGLGNAEADMQNLTQNLVDAFKTVVDNLVPVFGNIVAALPQVTGELAKAIADLLPTFLEAGAQIVTGLIEGVMEQLPALADTAFQVVNQFVISILEHAPEILLAGVEIVTNLMNGIAQSLPELIPAAVEAITAFINGLVDRLPDLLQAGIDITLGLVQGILNALPELIAELPKIITGIVDFLTSDETKEKIAKAGQQLLSSLADNIPEILDGLVVAVTQIVDGVIGELLSPDTKDRMGDAGVEFLMSLFDLGKIVNAMIWFLPKLVKNVMDNVVVALTGQTIREKFGETADQIVDEIVSYTSGLTGIDKIVGPLTGTNWRDNLRVGTTTEPKQPENTREPEERVEDYYTASKLDNLTSAIERQTQDLSTASYMTTDAVNKLGDTYERVSTSAGIKLGDSVEEAAQKIVKEVTESQKLKELIAEAEARAQEIIESNKLDRSDHTSAEVISPDGKIAWMFIPSQRESVTNNNATNINVNVDVSKVKKLDDIIRIADDAKSAARSGYVS